MPANTTARPYFSCISIIEITTSVRLCCFKIMKDSRRRSSWNRLQAKLFEGPISASTHPHSATFRLYFQESFSQSSALEVFHPESLFRLIWDWVLIAVVLHQAFQLPFELCFPLAKGEGTVVMEVLCVCLLMLDIGITLNTGYYSRGTLIKSRNRVISHYLQTWFCLDLIASFPLSWALSGVRINALANEETAAGTVGGLLRLLRLIRLLKLKPLLGKIEEYLVNDTAVDCFRLARLVGLMLFTGHWLACLTFYTSLMDYDSHPDLCHLSTCSPFLSEQYVSSLYFAFATMTTVGYGDVYPSSTNERLISILSMGLATGLMGFIMGSISSLISKRKATYSDYRLKVLGLNQYMRKHNLPLDLQQRVCVFLRMAWVRLKEESTEVPSAFSILSDPLKDAISAELTGALLRNCIVFAPFDSTFLANIGKKLQAEAFAPDDLVFESGQICGKMYFVTSGAVEMYHEGTGSTFTFLKRGQVFGEIGFFLGWPRCASSRCADYSDLLSLDRASMEPLLKQYPDAQKHFAHLGMQAHSSHNLSCLSIHCYLCEGLGHVAIHCKESVFQSSKPAKLQSHHTKYINKAVPPLPNYMRKDKHARRRISAANVIGGKRSPADMYPEDSHLYPLITEFEETLERERVRSTTTELSEGDRGKRIHFNFANFADSFNEEDSTNSTPLRTHTLHSAKVFPLPDRSPVRAGTTPNHFLSENK